MPKTSFALALASLALATATQAAGTTPADPVAASFERIFTEERQLPTPPSPTAASDDPLHQAFAVTQPSPHVRAEAQAQPGARPGKRN